MLGLRDKDTNFTKEVLSGIVIAIALIPEAVAFSFILGVNPLVGLYTSVVIGLITALFGGRPGMISAATGAVAAVFAPLVKDYGVEYLFLAVILMGCFQILFGLLDIGKLFRLMSKPIMLGCVNGLALIILLAQLEQFKVPGEENWLSGNEMILMLTLTLFTFFLILFIPRFIKSVPSSLIAIIITTVITLLLDQGGVHMYNVMDMTTSGGGAISYTFAPINLTTFRIILIPALSAALVGLVESLLTLNIIDEMTDTVGNSKKEAIAQGMANIASGFTFGMGGCAMIGQSMINLNNGARKYLSTFVAALFLLLFILVGKNIIGLIPLCALVGVMFVVVYKTFAWDSLFLHKKASLFDTFIVIIVASSIVLSGNLALGVIVGVIISTLKFAWVKSTKLEFTLENKAATYTLYINGVVFFGSENVLKDNVIKTINDAKQNNINNVILDFKNANLSDYSSAQTLNDLIKKYENDKINLQVVNLNTNSQEKYKRINNRVS